MIIQQLTIFKTIPDQFLNLSTQSFTMKFSIITISMSLFGAALAYNPIAVASRDDCCTAYEFNNVCVSSPHSLPGRAKNSSPEVYSNVVVKKNISLMFPC